MRLHTWCFDGVGLVINTAENVIISELVSTEETAGTPSQFSY